MKQNESENPIDVALFDADTVVLDPATIANQVKKAGFSCWLVHSHVSSMNYRRISTYRPDTNQSVRLTV